MFDFIPSYPLQKDVDLITFNRKIQSKKEFSELRIPDIENIPTTVGEPLKHQKLLKRYFSNETPYNNILLFHEMGTGKTCTSVQMAEESLKGSTLKKVLYLSRSKALNQNFLQELIFKCTKGQYVPNGWERMNIKERRLKLQQKSKEKYVTNTYEIFSKKIKKLSKENIIKLWDNSIIIIDEVQNLRVKDKGGGVEIYNTIWRFLHTLKHSKVILLSGTPMKNESWEFGAVMNLILPTTEQLPTEKQWKREMWNNDGNISKNGEKLLQRAVKGRVSYLSAQTPSNITKVIKGKYMGGLNEIKVVPSIMSTHQTTYYLKSLEKDRTTKGVYSQSRQASLMVFPDGTWGMDGVGKWIKERKKRGIVVGYSLTPAFRKEFTGTLEEKLDKIKKFSSKYYTSLKNIIQSEQKGEKTFIYNEFVSGGGLYLFAELLKLLGWSHWSEGKGQGRSFIKLTGSTPPQQIRSLINRFNRSDNTTGKYIQIILGSRAISEGFTFKNVENVDIQTPWFNYAETAQAIARVWRIGAHDELLKTTQRDIKVNVFHQVSLPNRDSEKDSIELQMYLIAEKKEQKIKKITNFIAENAWDCDFFKVRNKTRDCIGQPPGAGGEDKRNYQILYTDTKQCINEIITVLKGRWEISVEDLFKKLPKWTDFQIIASIVEMVGSKITVMGKSDEPCYVAVEGNKIYLYKRNNIENQYIDTIYTKKPSYRFEPKDLSTYIPLLKKKERLGLIEKVCGGELDKLDQLELFLQEQLFEKAVVSFKVRDEKLKDKLLTQFASQYTKQDNFIIHWIQYPTIRYYDTTKKIWKTDTDKGKFKKKVDELLSGNQQDMENNQYGYYGQVNPTTNAFCIRDVSQPLSKKKHKRTSGRVCLTIPKNNLLDIIGDKIKIKPQNDDLWKDINKMPMEDVLKKLQTKKYFKDKPINTIPNPKESLYWVKLKTVDICSQLRKWFDENKLLTKDTGCGSKDKIKI